MSIINYQKTKNDCFLIVQEKELQESIDTHKQEQGVIELENNIQIEEIDDLQKQLKGAVEDCKKLEKESWCNLYDFNHAIVFYSKYNNHQIIHVVWLNC